MKFIPCTVALFILSLPAFAARPVDLSHQNLHYLKSLSLSSPKLKEISQSKDFNGTSHIRIQQTYAGYPVWNGNGVIHKNKETTMNGFIYEDLDNDLHATNAVVFDPAQSLKALQRTNKNFPDHLISDKRSELMVYVDERNKAHWVFHISFTATHADKVQQPNYLMDAENFTIYQQWNNVKTLDLDAVQGGGVGGNPKLGKLIYDGLPDHLPALDIQRDAPDGTCYLQNEHVLVADYLTRKTYSYACYQPDRMHNNVYWNRKPSDTINDGYSPSTDSFYAGNLVQKMYKELFSIDVLTTPRGKPMPLRILTHVSEENAEWIDGANYIKIGDGENKFYPLASIGVIAHEVSHGFTSQHANLVYMGQPGGINESFSDMAAQVVERYALGHNNWQIGAEIVKANNSALRYMDYPSKDCQHVEPGKECSIDVAQDYKVFMNVHKSSGVFNRAFYLLATSPGWDVYKAFAVMIQANRHYWTPTANFQQAACGVVSAAKDYSYATDAVNNAFAKVGVDVREC